MGSLRVLVVDDSLTVRRRLADALSVDPDIEVVGEAEDGKRAIEVCLSAQPDVITMDMMMPIMSGLAATEFIMAHRPTPILIVSSSMNRGELFKTYDALAAGAVDVLEKPRGDEAEGEWERRFVGAVKLVSRIRVITHIRARLGALGQTPRRTDAVSSLPSRVGADGPRRARNCEVVAFGASTGGPAAIVEVLRNLPTDFALPILLVLHINAPFAPAFAEWLDAQTHYRAAYARDGEIVAEMGRRIALAPPDRHIVVRGGKCHLTRDPERHSCRPSVDVLFESLASDVGEAVVACLFTGMGRDGAAGLLRVREAGGVTIAQDEATSVVWGMPREAVLLGAATHVLPLGDIAPRLGLLNRSGAGAQP